MEILIWILVSYGMSQIIVFGSIFEGFRNSLKMWGDDSLKPFNFLGKFLSALTSCMMCTSTWVGFFLSFFWSPWVVIMGINPILAVFFDGMLSSGGVWAINAIIEWFENK